MRSTILCRAIGVTFKNWNLKTAIAHNSIVMVKQTGVIYIVIGTILNEPKTFIVIGIIAAIINKIACFENIPEFFIEYFNK